MLEYSQKYHEVMVNVERGNPKLLIGDDRAELSVFFAVLHKKAHHWKEAVYQQELRHAAELIVGPVEMTTKESQNITKRCQRYRDKLVYASLLVQEAGRYQVTKLAMGKTGGDHFIIIPEELLLAVSREVLPVPAILLYGVFVHIASMKGFAESCNPWCQQILGVNGGTVRKYVRMLRGLGLIVSIRGQSNNYHVKPWQQALEQLARRQDVLDGKSLRQLREACEPIDLRKQYVDALKGDIRLHGATDRGNNMMEAMERCMSMRDQELHDFCTKAMEIRERTEVTMRRMPDGHEKFSTGIYYDGACMEVEVASKMLLARGHDVPDVKGLLDAGHSVEDLLDGKS
jgi:hypothetical protein